MIEEQKALDLIALGEGQYVEFKESVPSKVRELSEEVCAFSNASGGFVLIGINNKTNLSKVFPSITPSALPYRILLTPFNRPFPANFTRSLYRVIPSG